MTVSPILFSTLPIVIPMVADVQCYVYEVSFFPLACWCANCFSISYISD